MASNALEHFSDDLVETLALLRDTPPEIGRLAIESLRPGSKEVLLAYGVIAIGESGDIVLRPTFAAFAAEAAMRRPPAHLPGPRRIPQEDVELIRELGATAFGNAATATAMRELGEEADKQHRETDERLFGRRCLAKLMQHKNPVSLNDLAQETRLDEDTVEVTLMALETAGFVEQVDARKFTVATATHCLLAIKVIAADKADATVYGVVSDLRGTIRQQVIAHVDGRDAANVIATIVRCTAELSDFARDLGFREVIGLGIELGGHVDSNMGEVINSPNLGWHSVVDLGDAIRTQTGLQTFVENDANGLVLSEWWFGSAQGMSHCIAVVIGDGIGSGLVLNGQLHRGAHGLAGELGHTCVEQNGPPCRCGRKGCLESIASERAIVGALQNAGFPVQSLADAETYAQDPRVVAVVEHAGYALGRALANYANLVNPEAIVVLAAPQLSEDGYQLGRPFRTAAHRAYAETGFSTAATDGKLAFHFTSSITNVVGGTAAVMRNFLRYPLAWDSVAL